MAGDAGSLTRPLVSVVLTTRDRPQLLPIALACFQHQSYQNRELIVVDDGDQFPVSDADLPSGSDRIIRVPSGTPLGIKLNHGCNTARGRLIMKMDDDDWYAPTYLETSVNALIETQRVACQPAIVFHMGFLFFELKTWQIHQSIESNAPGATLLFAKNDWQRRPFRPVPTDEDAWFYRDQVRAGSRFLTIDSIETFVAIRHRGHRGTFGHTWTYQLDGSTLEHYLTMRPIYKKTPEEMFPDWALTTYRSIHNELNADAEPSLAVSR
ncbi:MAG: glycosyltransferase family 2 protein [Dehalococcoidia bacterium]